MYHKKEFLLFNQLIQCSKIFYKCKNRKITVSKELFRIFVNQSPNYTMIKETKK